MKYKEEENITKFHVIINLCIKSLLQIFNDIIDVSFNISRDRK